MTNPFRNASPKSLFAFLMSLTLFVMAADGQVTTTAPAGASRYRNASLAIGDRVADLLPRMTLDEKVEQLTSGWENRVEVIDPSGTYTSQEARKVFKAEWGTEIKFTPRQGAILRNGVQRFIREKTRLGIPAMFLGEALHGFMEYGSKSFPQALGLAKVLLATPSQRWRISRASEV
jgi:hypothetical protein